MKIFFITNRQRIIKLFQLIYIVLTGLIIVSVLTSINNNTRALTYYSAGKLTGEIAIVIYIVTMIPGITERLSIKNQISDILRLYRRYIGILMYILAIIHFVFLKVIFVSKTSDLLPKSNIELLGMVSALLLFLLFITSNNISVRKLRINWFRIQRITYMAMFLIFLHVSLVSIGIWTVLMFATIFLQSYSFFISYRKTHSLTGGKPL